MKHVVLGLHESPLKPVGCGLTEVKPIPSGEHYITLAVVNRPVGLIAFKS